MRRLFVLGMLAATWVPLPATGSTAAPTCMGQVATIVGEPGGRVDGTEGPDVIVSNGAPLVFANDGTDVICMTAQAELVTMVVGNEGDDRILVTDGDSTAIYPGPGSDVVLGGPGREKVHVGSDGDPDEDPGTDVIETKGGVDLVVARHLGPVTARIEFGSGDDELRLLHGNHIADDAVVDGGRGSDELEVYDSFAEEEFLVDNSREVASIDGVTSLHWRDLEVFSVGTRTGAATVFVGSAEDEELAIYAEGGRRAEMKGGDDLVTIQNPDPAGSNISGGPGRDRLELEYDGDTKVSLDVARGSAVTGSEFGTVRFSGIDAYFLHARRVTMLGDHRADTLAADAVAAVLRGRAGDDSLSCWNDQSRGRGCARIVIHGDQGDDDLIGGVSNDLIDGGPGRDRANGRKGVDRCVAVEDRNDCERS